MIRMLFSYGFLSIEGFVCQNECCFIQKMFKIEWIKSYGCTVETLLQNWLAKYVQERSSVCISMIPGWFFDFSIFVYIEKFSFLRIFEIIESDRCELKKENFGGNFKHIL